jgi:hypothetical protein
MDLCEKDRRIGCVSLVEVGLVVQEVLVVQAGAVSVRRKDQRGFVQELEVVVVSAQIVAGAESVAGKYSSTFEKGIASADHTLLDTRSCVFAAPLVPSQSELALAPLTV